MMITNVHFKSIYFYQKFYLLKRKNIYLKAKQQIELLQEFAKFFLKNLAYEAKEKKTKRKCERKRVQCMEKELTIRLTQLYVCR